MTRRITFVIHGLSIGGAERVLATLANHFVEVGDEVTVITLAAVDSDQVAVDPRVQRIGLDAMRHSASPLHAMLNNVKRIRRLRRAIVDSRPTHVISFTDKMNIVTLMACRKIDVPVIIAERSDPRQQRLGRAWERLRGWVYPKCAALVAQTEPVAKFLRPLVDGKPVKVIPNAISARLSAARPPGSESERRNEIVAIGRLSHEKGFDLLMRAYARTTSGSHWRLRIAGDGPLRASLVDLADELKITDRVEMAGWTDNPAGLLQAAKIFVLPSRYEGFPNALLEAMASGLPVISFDCDSGPREIIRHELDGLLVPPEDVGALAHAMDRLMANAAERDRLASRATDVIDRFDQASFFRNWTELLDLVGHP